MQKQIQSYSFPLADNCSNSLITSLRDKKFLIATQSLHENSSSILYLFNYDEDNPKKSSSVSQAIGGSVIDLISAQDEKKNIKMNLAVLNDGKYKICLINDEKINQEKDILETIYQQDEQIVGVNFKRDLNTFYYRERNKICLFDLQKKQKSQWVNANEDITCMTVDPTHEYLTYLVKGKDIHICDKKSNNQKYVIKGSEKSSDQILSMDYNPNKQCYLMTCHHQSIKFWDIRKGNVPVRCYDDHHNILTQAKYNPNHDQLIACAYDDGSVGLMRIHSVCSSPQHEVDDTLIKLYDEHQDSVFHLAWSSFTPWLFASVTYNASSLVLNFVPSVEKYRILL